MTYHLTPMSKQQHPASSYEGLHLGTHRIRLSQRFAARVTGVRRVQLSYDAKARIICLTPSKPQKGPAGLDTFRMTKNARRRPDSLQYPACGDARRPLPVCATDPGGVYLHA
jgi:hypothetical protein